MKKLLILSSGRGTNLENILDKIKSGYLFNCSVTAIISNNNSVSLKRGINNHITTVYLPWNKSLKTRENYDYTLAQISSTFNPDIIVLSGWNHILSSVFIDYFTKTKIINLHPALIHTFPGNNAIEDAWNAGQRGLSNQTGIMVHTVTTTLDVGEVIDELIIPINKALKQPEFETMMKQKEKQVLINALDKMSTTLIYKGKVKNVYEVEKDKLLVLHTDRLSACNSYVCDIQNKGYFLSKIASWWFNFTKDIIKNHVIETASQCLIVERCEVIPIEFIVRGYICGSLWRHYNKGNREYSGIEFDDGLKQFQKLPNFIITPTTKDDIDEPISYDEIIRRGIITKEQIDEIYDICYKLYVVGSYECDGKNLILVDTKYEFGYNQYGELRLVDELHTVESSRYWYKDSYAECLSNGVEPKKIDKDIIRKYVLNNESIPSNILNKYLDIYIDFYNTISGESLTRYSTSIKDCSFSTIYNRYIEKRNSIKNSIVIISGSEIDVKHVEKIQIHLRKYNMNSDYHVCSAHKNTNKLLEILNENKNNAKLYITVAGMSNALSGVVACNTNVPVIACPHFNDPLDMMTNIHSSIQCPSMCPVMTILNPVNVAEVCNRICNM